MSAIVQVTVSGLTGSGKSRIAFEIETALKAIGVEVQWPVVDDQGASRQEAWAEANGAWQPDLPVVVLREVNIPREPQPVAEGEQE